MLGHGKPGDRLERRSIVAVTPVSMIGTKAYCA
jgi:hypothetical protein